VGGGRTLRSEVSNDARDDAEEDRSPEGDESRSGSRGDEARNAAGTPSDHRPLPRESEIKQTPRSSRNHSSQTTIPARHHSPQISPKRTPTIKPQPSKPQQHRPKRNKGHIMRAKVKHHLFLAFAENHTVGQGRAAGGDLDGTAAGVVEDAVFEGPAIGVPDPAGDGAVDEGGPPEGEDHGGDEAAALGDGAHDDCGGDGAEHHLVSLVHYSHDLSYCASGKERRGKGRTW
jgi:hypothetical protein